MVVLLLVMLAPSAVKAEPGGMPQPLSSLQSYTGIWQMPNARVLSDWHIRLQYGNDSPWRYYGGALGLWERLEFHGQFTETTTIEGFPGEGYGNAKDRSGGARLVVKKEEGLWPQMAIGAYDATGTAKFASRYVVASKMFGMADFTFGLGQGILAGEYTLGKGVIASAPGGDKAYSFLTSSLFRPTRPFGGIELHLTPDLTVSGEYTSIDYLNMYGVRNETGGHLKEDRQVPLNFGIKYQLTPNIHAQLALMGGEDVAGGIGAEFPLEPEGMLAWKKIVPKKAGERTKWQAYEARNEELAQLVGARVQAEGFTGVAVSVSDDAVWIEAANTLHLSDSRALGHIVTVADEILPPRIETMYLNLKQYGTIIQSLRASRADIRAFLSCRMDKDNFLLFADLDLYGDAHWREFSGQGTATSLAQLTDDRLSFQLDPRVRTFLNNRKGFFKSKAVVEARADYRLWQGAYLAGEYEITLFNDFNEVAFAPLEPDATRTDLVLYEENSRPRVSMLALDQHMNLPGNVMGRVSGGIFESAYAGLGAEAFRYFHDGLWGIGLEAETVRKRDIEDNFSLREDQNKWFSPAFVNLYAQLWPSQGLEGGLKIGRFLAGDMGVRFELRRSFKYFTVGAWYTVTDTSEFSSALNRGDQQKGVYIRLPLALFKDMDVKGHFRYLMTTFTRDPGQTVRQPSALYPMDPWSTPAHTRQTLDDMRIQ